MILHRQFAESTVCAVLLTQLLMNPVLITAFTSAQTVQRRLALVPDTQIEQSLQGKTSFAKYCGLLTA